MDYKAFALTGRLADCHYTQGVALGYELLPLQGVPTVQVKKVWYIYIQKCISC